MIRVLTSTAAATIFALAASAPAAAQQTTAGQQAVVREVNRTTARVGGAAGAATTQRSDFKVEQRDVKTQKLAVGSSGDVSLRNIVGDMTVKVGSGNEATLEITRVARGRTEDDAKLGLERVTVDVTVRGERAAVETRYPDDKRPNYSVSVSYNLTAPAGTGVTLDTVSGKLMVTGLRGEITAHAISGKIDLINCNKVASARTTSGDITLSNVQGANIEVEAISGDIHLTGIKAGRITANIVSGTIVANDVQAEGASLGTMSGDIAYAGSVTAKGRYEFRAHSGTVKLGLTGGFDLEARTFSGNVQADPSLGLTGATTTSKSIRGTTGNGGASVVATTFSGSVWVGKTLK